MGCKREYAGNMGGNPEYAKNRCGDAGNQGGSFGIAVGMTWSSCVNDQLKGWREVRIIENEHNFKNLVAHVFSGAF